MDGYRAFCLFVAKHNPAAMMQRSSYDVDHLGPVMLDRAWLHSFYEKVCDRAVSMPDHVPPHSVPPH